MPAIAPHRLTAPDSMPEPNAEAVPTPAPFRWTRERYDLAVDAGVFGSDDKIELLEGQIVPKMSQNTPHRTATLLTGAALRRVFAETAFVQEERPIALSDLSEPEPDAAVVRGSIRDHVGDHPGPADLLLLVEVADSSLLKDQMRMARLYAQAGVAEYWIVNLRERTLEIHRDPAGEAYRTKTTLAAGDTVTPVHAPDASISVADLLP